jgi:sugar phosphate isomerase/epimerase
MRSERIPPLACRYEVLPGESVMDRLEAAHRFGFEAVSFPGRFLATYEPQLRSCARDAPVAMGFLSLGFEGSLVSPDARIRARCRDSLRRLLDLCREVGLLGVNVPPALIQDNPVRYPCGAGDESTVHAQDAHLVDELPALCTEAHRLGVLLLLEPVNRSESEYMNTLDHAAAVCARVNHGSLGVTCDFYHMEREEPDPPGAIRANGKWIRHVHVSEDTRLEPGSGPMDFVPGFRALKEIGYSGMIELECRSLSGPAERVLPCSASYLRRAWERA